MLRVRTFLDRSEVEGIGLFAAEDIAEGRVVWEFSPHLDLVFEQAQWDSLCRACSVESMEQVRKYTYKEGRKYYVCFDNAQFMNHSSDHPNVRGGNTGFVNIAARKIMKGEEILCDYFEYCDPDDHNLTILRKIVP